MYFLFGLNHLIQYRNKQVPSHYYGELASCLKEIISQYGVALIAEEYNEDCLLLNNVKQSFLQEFTQSEHLGHRFIDPTLQNRIKLGIASPYNALDYEKAYSTREAWWYEHLKDVSEAHVLVCLGAHHVSSFEALLKAHHESVMTLCAYWEEASFSSHNL